MKKLKDDSLTQLLKLFQKYQVLSYERIATLQNTYPATAKRRVLKLMAQGVKLKPTSVREGERGPLSAAWMLEG